MIPCGELPAEAMPYYRALAVIAAERGLLCDARLLRGYSAGLMFLVRALHSDAPQRDPEALRQFRTMLDDFARSAHISVKYALYRAARV